MRRFHVTCNKRTIHHKIEMELHFDWVSVRAWQMRKCILHPSSFSPYSPPIPAQNWIGLVFSIMHNPCLTTLRHLFTIVKIRGNIVLRHFLFMGHLCVWKHCTENAIFLLTTYSRPELSWISFQHRAQSSSYDAVSFLYNTVKPCYNDTVFPYGQIVTNRFSLHPKVALVQNGR